MPRLMTEQEWLSCTEPRKILPFALARANQRKLQLVLCAAFRRIGGDAHRAAWETSERFADGQVSSRDLERAWWQAKVPQDFCEAVALPRAVAARACFQPPAESLVGEQDENVFQKLGRLLGRSLCDLLRDVLGNPFRPVVFHSTWRTPEVVALATTIYEQQSFDRLPELADALERAGCDNEDLLRHCRERGQLHARGCWAVDLVLGRE